MNKPIAENKKARFDYNITETLEAGIVLLGSEVKSLRLGKASIREAYASQEHGDLILINFNIPEYDLAAKGQNSFEIEDPAENNAISKSTRVSSDKTSNLAWWL